MHEQKRQYMLSERPPTEYAQVVTNPTLQGFLDGVGNAFAEAGEGGQFQLTEVINHIRHSLGLSRGHADSVRGLICRERVIDAEKRPGGKGQRYFVDKTGVLACAALLWTYKEQVKKRYGVYRMDKNIPRNTLPEQARALLGPHELSNAIRDSIQKENKTKSPRAKQQVKLRQAAPVDPALAGAKRGRPLKTEQHTLSEARTPLQMKIPRMDPEKKQEAYGWGREQLTAVLPYLADRDTSLVNLHDPEFTKIMPRHVVQMIMFVDAAGKERLVFFHPTLEYPNQDDLFHADVEKAVRSCLQLYFDDKSPKVRSLGELFDRWVKEVLRREQENSVKKA